jgi:hemerythrin-like domain-containing protein
MKATQQLRAEHEGIQLMLRILEAICRKLEAGERVNPDHMEGIIEFFRVFVDHCHHGKEEELLFPVMEAAGVIKQGGPLGVML